MSFNPDNTTSSVESGKKIAKDTSDRDTRDILMSIENLLEQILLLLQLSGS